MAPTIAFGPQVCGDLRLGSEREWLVTDGLGGYAMGTVSGLRTRRYHGLLMVAGRPPANRHLALASLDPELRLPSGTTVALGTHEWAGGTIAPEGHRLLTRFDLTDGLPRWRWRIGDVVLERELAMVYGRPVVAVVHRLVAAPGPVRLSLAALGTWRDGHCERHAWSGPLAMEPVADGVVIEGSYRLAGPGWSPAGEWWYAAWAREEAARGLNPSEDLWLAGRFAATLEPGEVMEVTAWAGDLATPPPPATEVVAAARRRAREVVARARRAAEDRPTTGAPTTGAPTTDAPTTGAQTAGGASVRLFDDVDATLALAADAFVIAGRSFPDVIAGYPWFGVWSRDTMTSFEGLFLETGRAEEGRALLLGYADTLSEGMLANTADTGRTEYNTVDATLWYLHALHRQVRRTGDDDLAAAVVDRLDSVVEAHLAGTRYGIRVDPADGLLTQGSEGKALTWMDACIDGVACTPRAGKPVEVNALWINGLAAIAELRRRTGRDPSDIITLRDRALVGFLDRFPAPGGWLHDVVDGPDGDDPTLRPNQLLAYSLPDGPLHGQVAPAILGRSLCTPLGLRTRAPGGGSYRGTHRGGPIERDLAYHDGTVWPWLIGPYAATIVRSRTVLPELLGGIEAHLSEWGLGSVSETADGDPPHRATGCPFQAWSVAEVLRVRRTDL